LNHPLWQIRDNVRTPSITRWKAVVNFLFVIIELFSLSLVRFRRCKWKSVKVGVFRTGWFTLSANFRLKKASSTNHCSCQKTRVISLSWYLQCIVWFSHKARVCQTDGQTDGQNYVSQDRASIAASHVRYSMTSVGHGADPGFLAVSLQVTLVINPVVGCRSFPPGPRLLFQPKRSPLLAATKSCCLVTEAQV